MHLCTNSQVPQDSDFSSVLSASRGVGTSHLQILVRCGLRSGWRAVFKSPQFAMLRLHCKDERYTAPRVSPHPCPPCQHGIPCVSPTFTPTHVAGLHFPFHVLSDESVSFSTCGWSDLRGGPATVDEIKSVPHPFADSPSLPEPHSAEDTCVLDVLGPCTSVFVLCPLP